MTNNRAKGKRLIVLLGATGVGKTDTSIALANHLHAPIVSSDSRQFFREMSIGTAVPSPQELAVADHYFIHSRSVREPYNAGAYEADALQLLHSLFSDHSDILLVGGSGMYIDALCHGFDSLPEAPAELRQQLNDTFRTQGLEPLLLQLEQLDPTYAAQVDRKNHARIIRALEVCLTSNMPYSTLRSGQRQARDFTSIKIGLERPREELYERINLRVDLMIEQGLVEEARTLYPFRDLQPLRSVGYSELFDHFDGKTTLSEAIELIKRNSRRYAKRQTTWFGRDTSTQWFSPDDPQAIIDYIDGLD